MAPPLFLLAPPRSYTSLVNAMLGQHPQAFGLPELCLFNVEQLVDLWRGSDGPISENGAVARHGLMRALAEIYGAGLGRRAQRVDHGAGFSGDCRQDSSIGGRGKEPVLHHVQSSPGLAVPR